jgi:hypothetical protein
MSTVEKKTALAKIAKGAMITPAGNAKVRDWKDRGSCSLLLDESERTWKIQIQYQPEHSISRLRVVGVRKCCGLLPDTHILHAGHLRRPEHLR